MPITLEATIVNGRIILDEPEKLPSSERARVTVIASEKRVVNLEAVEQLLNSLSAPSEGLEYERQIRSEWDDRNRPAPQASERCADS